MERVQDAAIKMQPVAITFRFDTIQPCDLINVGFRRWFYLVGLDVWHFDFFISVVDFGGAFVGGAETVEFSLQPLRFSFTVFRNTSF